MSIKKLRNGNIKAFFAVKPKPTSSSANTSGRLTQPEQPQASSNRSTTIANERSSHTNRSQHSQTHKTTAMGSLTSREKAAIITKEETAVNVTGPPNTTSKNLPNTSKPCEQKKKPTLKKARSSIVKPSLSKTKARQHGSKATSPPTPTKLSPADEGSAGSPIDLTECPARNAPLLSQTSTTATTTTSSPEGSSATSPIDLTPRKKQPLDKTSPEGSAASPIDLTPSSHRRSSNPKRSTSSATKRSLNPNFGAPVGSSAASPIDLTPSRRHKKKRTSTDSTTATSPIDLTPKKHKPSPPKTTTPAKKSLFGSDSKKAAASKPPPASKAASPAKKSLFDCDSNKPAVGRAACTKPSSPPTKKAPPIDDDNEFGSPLPLSCYEALEQSVLKERAALQTAERDWVKAPTKVAAPNPDTAAKQAKHPAPALTTPLLDSTSVPVKTLNAKESPLLMGATQNLNNVHTPALTTPPVAAPPSASQSTTNSKDVSSPLCSPALPIKNETIPKPTKGSICRVLFDTSATILSTLKVSVDVGSKEKQEEAERCWYPGTVEKVTWLKRNPREATVNVRYFDGTKGTLKYHHHDTVEEMRRAEPQDIEMLVPVTMSDGPTAFRIPGSDTLFLNRNPTGAQVGDRVQAHYRSYQGLKEWYAGRIMSIENSSGQVLCSIFYDDGECEVGVPLTSQYVHVIEKGFANPNFLLGLACVTSKGQKEIKGRIVAVEATGSVKIKQDGGEKVMRSSYSRSVDGVFKVIKQQHLTNVYPWMETDTVAQKPPTHPKTVHKPNATTNTNVKAEPQNQSSKPLQVSKISSTRADSNAAPEEKKPKTKRPRTTKKRNTAEIKPRRRASKRQAEHRYETVTEAAKTASMESYVPRSMETPPKTVTPQKEIGPTLSCAVQKALTSCDSHVGSEIFQFLCLHHNQKPDVDLCRVLLKLIFKGPVSGSIQFPDTQRMQRVQDTMQLCISQNPKSIDVFVGAAGETLFADCLESLKSNHYQMEGDATRDTHFALDRLAQTVHLKTLCAGFLVQVLEHQLGPSVKSGGRDNVNQPELLKQTLVKEICGNKRSTKAALEQILGLLQQNWAFLGQFTTSSATQRAGKHDMPEDSIHFLQEMSSLLLKQLGKISSYILWLHCFMEDESPVSLAHLIRNSSSMLCVEGDWDMSPFGSGEMQSHKHWSKVRLSLVLSLDAGVIPEVRPILADLFGVGAVFNAIFGF